MMIGAVMLGFVSVWFLFAHMPHREFLGDILHDDMLRGIGFAQSRVLLPLVLCLLLAARNGAIVAADLGNRTFTDQVRAMRNLHVPMRLYLLVPSTIANVLSFLLGVGLTFGLCALVSLATWRAIMPEEPLFRFHEAFFERVPGLGAPVWPELGWVVLKTAGSALVVSVSAIVAGLRPKTSVRDLNAAVAQAIIWGVALTLAVHTGTAFFEFSVDS